MNKVTLVRLPITELSISYARRYEGTNKITHYRVGDSHIMVGVDPLQAIKDYIVNLEGPTEFEIEQSSKVSSKMLLELAPQVLENEPKIKAALEQKQIRGLLFEQVIIEKDITKTDKLLNILSKFYNPVAHFLNKVLTYIQYKLYSINQIDIYGMYHNTHDETDIDYDYSRVLETVAKLNRVKLLPTIQIRKVTSYNRIHPCTFLSLSYEEGDDAIAENILREDIRKYYDKDMILGHLVTPSRITLEDTIGSGKRKFALLCFLFVDNFKIPGFDPTTAPKVPTPLEGIRTANYEGNVTILPELDYSNRYEIEKVNVVNTYEQNRKAYVDSYLNSVPAVNEAAKKMKAALKIQKEGL